MKTVILFDMDGTLTPAREAMENSMLRALKRIVEKDIEIGIVTGSDMNYLEQQCEILFEVNNFDPGSIHYLPCNGTKYYGWKNGKFFKKHEVDMIKKIGKQQYDTLIRHCMLDQLNIMVRHPELDYTGNFLDYRGSVLNWCPIGRSATKEQRHTFVAVDKKQNIRLKSLENMRQLFSKDKNLKESSKLHVALGGETSFDIYPPGWDKTYALQFFAKDYDIYFVGDKCKENGNDRTIYEACGAKGYQTTGPDNTVKIIESILNEKS